MENKSCCFIGHRKVQNKEAVYLSVKQIIEALISEKGVRAFHFGSKSEFDDICHKAVTELQDVHPDIVRINYNRKSEYVVKKDEKAKLEESWSLLLKEEITLKDFEKAKSSERVYKAGKASYVQRNREMIDDSDFCVFFYIEGYRPESNPHYTSSGKSGTKLAFNYAVQKKKTIINIADMI